MQYFLGFFLLLFSLCGKALLWLDLSHMGGLALQLPFSQFIHTEVTPILQPWAV